MYTMSLRFEADIYCLLHTWYYSIESEIEDLDNSGFLLEIIDGRELPEYMTMNKGKICG